MQTTVYPERCTVGLVVAYSLIYAVKIFTYLHLLFFENCVLNSDIWAKKHIHLNALRLQLPSALNECVKIAAH